jgi:hypothetical protein
MANHAPHLASRQSIAIIGNQRDLPWFQPWTPPLVLPENLGVVGSAPIFPRACVRRNVSLGSYEVIPNYVEPMDFRWFRRCRFRGQLEPIE